MKINQPLSPNSKTNLIAQIEKKIDHIDNEVLSHWLISAALQGYVFPSAINEKLTDLQAALVKFEGNTLVLKSIHQAIGDYISTEGVELFQKLLKQTIPQVEWKSGFVRFLSAQFSIALPVQYLIEVQIDKGKAYWRVIDQNGKVQYDRAKEKCKKFTFDSEQSWVLSVEEFLEFKNSGKRWSNVPVTEDEIASYYDSDSQEWAGDLYNELERLEIITNKQKVSAGFRLLSAQTITVDPHLMQQEHIKSHIVDHLYRALDKRTNDEKITVNGKVLFVKSRTERSRKLAAKTGRITNAERESENYSVQIWDVSIHRDLTAYYNAEHVLQALDKDHIPSSATFRSFAQTCIDSLNIEIKKLSANMTQRQNDLDKKILNLHQKPEMRGPLTKALADSIKKHFPLEQSVINALEAEIKSKKNIIEQIKVEKSSKSGAYWWTVAIPKALHKQGLSTKERESDQQKNIAEPFHDEVSWYLDIIENRAAEVGLSHADFIKALGAFRTLFHFQLKHPGAIGENQVSGIIPSMYYHAQKGLIQKVDTLFNQRMRQFLLAREDLNDKKALKPIVKCCLFPE